MNKCQIPTSSLLLLRPRRPCFLAGLIYTNLLFRNEPLLPLYPTRPAVRLAPPVVRFLEAFEGALGTREGPGEVLESESWSRGMCGVGDHRWRVLVELLAVGNHRNHKGF